MVGWAERCQRDPSGERASAVADGTLEIEHVYTEGNVAVAEQAGRGKRNGGFSGVARTGRRAGVRGGAVDSPNRVRDISVDARDPRFRAARAGKRSIRMSGRPLPDGRGSEPGVMGRSGRPLPDGRGSEPGVVRRSGRPLPDGRGSEPGVVRRSGRPLPDGRGSEPGLSEPGVVVRSDAPAESRTRADVPLSCRAPVRIAA